MSESEQLSERLQMSERQQMSESEEAGATCALTVLHFSRREREGSRSVGQAMLLALPCMAADNQVEFIPLEDKLFII